MQIAAKRLLVGIQFVTLRTNHFQGSSPWETACENACGDLTQVGGGIPGALPAHGHRMMGRPNGEIPVFRTGTVTPLMCRLAFIDLLFV